MEDDPPSFRSAAALLTENTNKILTNKKKKKKEIHATDCRRDLKERARAPGETIKCWPPYNRTFDVGHHVMRTREPLCGLSQMDEP